MMRLRIWLRRSGLSGRDCAAPRMVDGHTGAACILVDDETGDNGIVIARGAALALMPEMIDPEMIERADVFLS